jgi:hypothetical protein
MALAERTMNMSGWLDPSPDGLPDVGSLIPMQPEVEQSGKLWRAAVLAKKKEILQEKIKDMPIKSDVKHSIDSCEPNVVRVVNKEYIDKSFNLIDPNDKTIIDTIIADYILNNEQERAFRIIANHATIKIPSELCMYLGGVGGTGKSQVIKAVMDFFNRHRENYRFLVVAPTGAAAALLVQHTIQFWALMMVNLFLLKHLLK